MVDVPGGRVWYQLLGPDRGLPLLMLHGGPGSTHGYIRPLALRLATRRRVIVYDQLGCGRSDQPDDPGLWTLDRAVNEVAAVRSALGLERCGLFAHSWAGWLALEYLCGDQGDAARAGVDGLVLASTSASIPQFVAETDILIDAVPEPDRTILREYGAQGRYREPTYLAAVDHFYRRHLCRMDPWPTEMDSSMEEEAENQAYAVLSGPNDLVVTGTLRDWDRSAALGRIEMPALVTCGRYDAVTPACSQTLVDGLPHARLAVFEQSAHVPHLEEPDLYAETVDAFLASVDG